MSRKKPVRKKNETITLLADVVGVIDDTVERFTGKRISGWFQESIGQSIPPLEGAEAPKISTPQSSNDPYSILGLPPSATKEQVRTRYKQLANIFHPDRENGYSPAMTRINQAYEEIMKGKAK